MTTLLSRPPDLVQPVPAAAPDTPPQTRAPRRKGNHPTPRGELEL